MDFTYEIFGRAAFVDAIKVVIVSTVVTPRPTRAGVAPRFSLWNTNQSNLFDHEQKTGWCIRQNLSVSGSQQT
jgi:hypothetical protein